MKKKRNQVLPDGRTIKAFRIMKLSFIFSFITLLNISAGVYSQDQKFNISMRNAKLTDVFEQIEKKSDISFYYRNEDIDQTKTYTVNYKNEGVTEILDDLLKNSDLTYRMIDNFVAVLKAKHESPNTAQQQKTVSGKVIDKSGDPIPGVSVYIKGTTTGTTTDIDGKYALKIDDNDAVLVFSFIGYEKQEITVGQRTEINITLLEKDSKLNEVVVTALGIKREEKTLSYAQQTVNSAELTKTRDVNFLNSLSGKAAGVEIKKSSSGAGGSTKMVLRGSKSLSGNSEPLFVIDGIPMVNYKGSQPGMWGGTDQGDGISQLNPDDIESVTILKGSNAAALYGSQGANGVVLITTKSGKKGKTTVNINSGTTFEQVMLLPELQYKYGSVNGAKESWSYTAGDYDDTFVKDFFRTGINLINSVSVSGGNDKTIAYFSYANTTNRGIVPMNRYRKNNLTFKQSTKLFKEKVTITSNVMLASERTENRNAAGYYLNPLTGLYFFPRDRDFYQYKNEYEVFDPARNMMTQNWFVEDHHQSNPYWIINREPKDDRVQRVITNLDISWALTKKLVLSARGNYDFSLKKYEQQHHAGSNTTNTAPNGRWQYKRYTDELIYCDAMLKYDDTFGAFSLNLIGGGSYQKSVYGLGVSVDTGTNGLLYPNEFYFQNIPTNVQVRSTLNSRMIKQALFVSASLGFKDMLFLDLSGRNDWASTLAGTGNDSYFYPAFGVTALLNQMLNMPTWISYAKLRASHSTVANEVPFNKVNPQNTIDAGGGVRRNTTKPFTNLKPEMLRSLELGTDWRFFTGRLGFDFTYYNINSKDQFIRLPAPSGSGYTYYYVNAGEIVNKGVEIVVDGTIIKRDNLVWNTSLNYAKNNNEVVELHPDLKSPISTGISEGYESKFVAGGSIGDIYVYMFKRDEQGRIMLDDNGAPLKTKTSELIGNLNPDWSMGWNNSIDYQNFNLSFLINSKVGGKVVSQTEAMLDGMGVSLRTGEARDKGYVEVNGVQNGTPVTQVDPLTWYSATGYRNGIKEPYTYDRTNIRLSQLSLTYTFNLKNSNVLKRASLSFVGQNLFFFYKKAPFDPELAMNTGRNYQSLDNFNLPTTRTLGFNINITF